MNNISNPNLLIIIISTIRWMIEIMLPIVVTTILSYFRLFFHPYEIELRIESPKPKVYDNIVVLKLQKNYSSSIEIGYKLNKPSSLVYKLVEWLNIEKIKLRLVVGMGYSSIVFSSKKGVSENIVIIPKKAVPSKSVFTCNFRLDENLSETDIVPMVELEFSDNTSWAKRFLAENIFFRVRVNWKQGKKVKIEL